MKKTAVTLALWLSLTFPGFRTAIADEPPVSPAATLSPAAVVEAQLAALREDSDDGLLRAFSFASPANRAQTGPAPRFAEMIRKGYPELLGHQTAVLGPSKLEDDTAMQAVDVISREGQLFHYLFILSRQPGGDCSGCWMTDGVFQTPAEDGTAI